MKVRITVTVEDAAIEGGKIERTHEYSASEFTGHTANIVGLACENMMHSINGDVKRELLKEAKSASF